MSRQRQGRPLLILSLLAALWLGLVPLPELVAPLRPFWIALVLSYWLLETPQQAGLGLAFICGLVADLVFGTLFGEHALRLTVFAFLVLRFRPRLRFFPLSQQALAIFALLVNDRVLVLAIRAASGEALPPWSFWLSPLTGLLLWPWLFLLLDELRLRGRSREG